MNTSFVIADNQDITRMGLRAYIASLFGQATVVEAHDKQQLTELLATGRARPALPPTPLPVVVILDYTLFDLNGVDDLLVIRARFPHVLWMLFANELSEDFIRKLCVLPDVSIVLKDNSGEEIRSALVCATRGERYLCHQITNLLAGGFASRQTVRSTLTATETEILKLIAKGSTVKEMAAERNSSIHTIITHKKNIFRKLGVNNVYEATKYALRAGLVEVMEYYI